jgi:hypothetical protein
VELDALRAGVEAALRLLERRLVQVEPDEGDEASAAPLGEGEGPVVRRPERRVAVGLVEAEHEGARRPVALHELYELLVVADHPVEIRAEVHVGVEELRSGGNQTRKLDVVACDELQRPFLRVHGTGV